MGLRVSPTAADTLVVNGTARLAGGLQVLAQGGTFAPRSTRTIVTATGGLIGAFQSVASTAPFLVPTLSYDANNAYLTLQAALPRRR
jgi:outer membrane autotransporter protein